MMQTRIHFCCIMKYIASKNKMMFPEPDEPEAEETPSKAGNEMFLGIFGLMKKPSRGNKSLNQGMYVSKIVMV